MGKVIVLVALCALPRQHVECCVLGHSLVPTFIPLNSSTVQLEILRYPGATIVSLTDKLTDLDFWTRRYDGIILFIGSNDLARRSVDEVFNRLCALCRRLRTQTTFLTICTVEYRLYPRQNRFRVDQETYRRKVVLINHRIKRFARGIDCQNCRFRKEVLHTATNRGWGSLHTRGTK